VAVKGFEGAALRYGDFFDALAGRFDGTWSYDDADLAVLSLPVLAAHEDASTAFRLLLEGCPECRSESTHLPDW
jgi:hypothetical protein